MGMHAQPLSSIRLFATSWTAACQFSLSMGSSWQDNWSGLPFPIPGGLPDSGIKLTAPAVPTGKDAHSLSLSYLESL